MKLSDGEIADVLAQDAEEARASRQERRQARSWTRPAADPHKATAYQRSQGIKPDRWAETFATDRPFAYCRMCATYYSLRTMVPDDTGALFCPQDAALRGLTEGVA